MGIESSTSSSSNTDTIDSKRSTDPSTRKDVQRDPPMRDKVDRFEALMQKREEAPQKGKTEHAARSASAAAAQTDAARGEEQLAVTARQDKGGYSGTHDDAPKHQRADTLSSIDNASLWQAQAALREAGLPPPTAPTPVNPNAFADLVERHVRQLAISRGGLDKGDGQVLLRLSDSTLPGTDLLLSRTDNGWRLKADTRSRDSYDAILAAAPGLAKRFADRDMGTLTIDPEYHG